jgi:hypothetical protein
VNQALGAGTAKLTVHRQRHLEYCVVKFGCYANTYPWIRLSVTGAGKGSYTGKAY